MTDALMVSSSFLPGNGGIESYLSELCLELSPRLSAFAPGQRDGKSLPDDLPYPVYRHDGLLLVPGPSAARAVASAAAAAGTDRILFGTPWPLILLGPRLRRLGFRYASIVHGAEILVPSAVPWARGLLIDSLKGADLLLPVSTFTRGRLERLLGSHHPSIEVLRARVDTDRFHPRVDAGPIKERFGLWDHDVILTFGRLVRRKGVHRLLRALPDVVELRPRVRLVVAGTGPEERALRRMGASLGNSVVFTGAVSPEDAPRLYTAADIFALAACDRWWGLDTEGLGVVLLEASACGTPCVTGKSGGTPEAVLDGVGGRVVDASEQDTLSTTILSLLHDPETAHRMGAAARDYVVAEFGNRRLPAALLQWLA